MSDIIETNNKVSTALLRHAIKFLIKINLKNTIYIRKLY